MIRGAGPDHPWDAAAEERLQAAPEPHVGRSRDVSLFIRAPLPPRIALHSTNMLQATEIHTWGREAATLQWLLPEGGATRLTVAHFKNGGLVYDDALSRLGDIPVTLLLMLSTDLAAALCRELDSWEGLRVGWEAAPQKSVSGALWYPTSPGATRTWRPPPPRGHARPEWDDLIAAFHSHEILPDEMWQEVRQKTLGRDYRRRVRPPLLELWEPLCQQWDDL